MKDLMRFTTFILLSIFALLLVSYRPAIPSKVPLTSTEFEFTAKVVEAIAVSFPVTVIALVVVEDEEAIIEYSEPLDDIKPNPTLNILYIANPPPTFA